MLVVSHEINVLAPNINKQPYITTSSIRSLSEATVPMKRQSRLQRPTKLGHKSKGALHADGPGSSHNDGPTEVATVTSNNSNNDQVNTALENNDVKAAMAEESGQPPLLSKKKMNAKALKAKQKKANKAEKEATTNDVVEAYTVSHRLPEFISKFDPITKPGTHLIQTMVTVAGRVQAIRGQGKPTVFYDIHGDGAKLQLVTSAKNYAAGAKAFNKINTMIKIGDILGARGYAGKTKGSTLSVFVVELVVLDPLCNTDNSIHKEQKTNVGCESGKRNEQRKKRDVCIEDESNQKDASSTGPSVTSNSAAKSLPIDEALQNDGTAAAAAVAEAEVKLDEPCSKNTLKKLKTDKAVSKRKKAETETTKSAIDAYVTHRLKDFISEFDPITKPGTHLIQNTVAVAGRVQSIRGQGEERLFYKGKPAIFYRIQGDGVMLYLVACVKDYAAGAKAFNKINKVIKIGDMIGARGYAGKKKGGTLSLFVVELVLFNSPVCPGMPSNSNAGGQGDITNNIQVEQKTTDIHCENGKKNRQRKKREVCTEDESKQDDVSSTGLSAKVTLTSHSDEQSLPDNATLQNDVSSAVSEAKVELDETGQPPLSKNAPKKNLEANDAVSKEKKTEKLSTTAVALVCNGSESELNDASSTGPSAEVTVTSNSVEQVSGALQDDAKAAMVEEEVESDETGRPPLLTNALQKLNVDEAVADKQKKAEKEATKAVIDAFVSHRLPDFISEFNPITKPGTRLFQKMIAVAGRVQAIRGKGEERLFYKGKPTMFYDIEGDGVKLQLMASEKDYAAGVKAFNKINKVIMVGDMIGARGYAEKTNAGKTSGGTLSVFAVELVVLNGPVCLGMLLKANAGDQGGITMDIQVEEKTNEICEQCKKRDVVVDESNQKDASSSTSSVTPNSVDQLLPVNDVIQDDVKAAMVEEKVELNEIGGPPLSVNALEKLTVDEAVSKRKKAEKEATKSAIDAYVSHRLRDFRSEFDPITEPGTHLIQNLVTVAGHVQAIRGQGKPTMFYDIKGDGAKLQLVLSAKNYAAGAKAFNKINTMTKIGATIGARGYVGKTKGGTLSVFPIELVVLGPGGKGGITKVVQEQKPGKRNKQRKKQELKVNSSPSLGPPANVTVTSNNNDEQVNEALQDDVEAAMVEEKVQLDKNGQAPLLKKKFEADESVADKQKNARKDAAKATAEAYIVSHRLPDFISKFDPITKPGTRLFQNIIAVAGRVQAIRGQGNQITFHDIQGDGAKVHLISSQKDYAAGVKAFNKIHKMITIGDMIGARGYAGKSKGGTLSLLAVELVVLGPSCCPGMLPDANAGGQGGIVQAEEKIDEGCEQRKKRDVVVEDESKPEVKSSTGPSAEVTVTLNSDEQDNGALQNEVKEAMVKEEVQLDKNGRPPLLKFAPEKKQKAELVTAAQKNAKKAEAEATKAAIEAYVSHSPPDFISEFNPITKPGTRLLQKMVAVAGRVQAIRGHGNFLKFFDIHGDGFILHLVACVKDYAAGAEAYNKIIAVIKIGDIIGARGYPGKSKGGKLSLMAVELVVLSPLPSPHMLPQANAGGQYDVTDKIEEEQKTSVGCENGKRNEQGKKRDVCIEDESKQEVESSTGPSADVTVTSNNSDDQSLPFNEALQHDVSSAMTEEKCDVCLEDKSKQKDSSPTGPSAEVLLTSHTTAQSLPANETVDDATSAMPEAYVELDGTGQPPLSTNFLKTKLKAGEVVMVKQEKAENVATKAVALDCKGNEPELKGASSIFPSPEDTVPSISDDESLPANKALQNNLTSAMPKEMCDVCLEDESKQKDSSTTESSATVTVTSNTDDQSLLLQNDVSVAMSEEVQSDETRQPTLSTDTVKKLKADDTVAKRNEAELDTAAEAAVETIVPMQQRSQHQRPTKLGLRPGGSVYASIGPEFSTDGSIQNDPRQKGASSFGPSSAEATMTTTSSEGRLLPVNEALQDATASIAEIQLDETDHSLSKNGLKKELKAETGGVTDIQEPNLKRNRRRNKPELKVNSRASPWASFYEEKKKNYADMLEKKKQDMLEKKNLAGEEMKKYSGNGGRTKKNKRKNGQRDEQEDIGNTTDDDNGHSKGSGGAQATAKEAWAAARAQREQYTKENGSIIDSIASTPTKGGEDDLLGSLRSASTLYISAKCLTSDIKSSVTINDTTNSAPPKIRIRDEWEKNDNGYTKTKVEEDMEVLLQSINDTDMGLLSSTFADLPIELCDENGGYITTTQDQLLSEATAKMMDSWRDMKKWTKDEARLAGQILLRMEKEEVFGGGAAVEKNDYLAVINAYAKVTAEDETASIRAENLLDHMERRASEGRPDLAPDRLMINTVMGAQAKHSLSGKLSMNSISAAERMLATLEREYAQGDNTMQPTARTYSKFIDLYAKNGQPDKAATALDRMEYQYRHGNKAALPTTIHYTSVIDSLAKTASSSSAAARTAEQILRSMLDLYDKGERHLAPDTIVFSATIDAYAKSGRHDASERSLAILDLMDDYKIFPDIITYNTLLNTLAKSTNFQYYSISKDILNYIEESPDLRADAFTYNSIIKGCPPKEAESLIQHWEMEYKSGRTDERPDSYTYCSLIRSWTMSNTIGFVDKCLDILHWMEDNHVIGMNRFAYNEVMKACSRSSRDDAGDLAGGVFNQLIARYKRTRDPQFRPDSYTYMNLITAHTRSCSSHESAMKAEYILFDMMDSNIIPDNILCNAVISGWARSGSDDAILHAEEVCNRMDALGIETDGVCFNSLINVYAKSNHPEKSVRSLQVLERMEERRVAPTSVTYTLLFEACQDDDEFLMKVFESCIEHGLLDKRLQDSFMDYGPACIKERLGGSIPYTWSENANRGPGGMSRNQIKKNMKRGSTGKDVSSFGWAR